MVLFELFFDELKLGFVRLGFLATRIRLRERLFVRGDGREQVFLGDPVKRGYSQTRIQVAVRAVFSGGVCWRLMRVLF